jgi:hypothetical protein
MNESNEATKHRKRDGETYIAVGIFVVAVGAPVMAGTYWAALTSPRAAVVNGICGATLLLIGFSAIAYGLMLLRRHRRES